MTIKENLKIVIRSINDFSNQTNMVAINATIQASKLAPTDGAPFKVIASEIQRMSGQSLKKLNELDKLVVEIAELTILINKTGSLRMLLMKMVNAHVMNNAQLLTEAKDTFNSQLHHIKNSKINEAIALPIIHQIGISWADFQLKLHKQSAEEALLSANELIKTINVLITEYEKYAG